MQENIDLMMSNYLSILANENLQKMMGLTQEQLYAMKEALKIYVSTTTVKYVGDFRNLQAQSYDEHPKLDSSGPKVF